MIQEKSETPHAEVQHSRIEELIQLPRLTVVSQLTQQQ